MPILGAAPAATTERAFFVDRHRTPPAVPMVSQTRHGAHFRVHAEPGDPTDAAEVAGPALTGSRRLVGAVIWQALVDLGAVAQARPHPLEVARAATWFASDDASWPYSFVNCCAALGLEPAAVRAALAAHGPGHVGLGLFRRQRT